MSLLITLLIYILIFSLIWFILNYILRILEVQQPFVNIAKVVFMIVILVIILGVFFQGNYFIDLPRIK